MIDLFDLETSEGGPAPGGGAPEPVAAEPAPGPAPEPASIPSDGSWSPSQDEWRQTQEFIQAAGPFIGELYQRYQSGAFDGPGAAAPEPMQAAAPSIDPWDPQSVQAYINHAIESGLARGLEENLGPYEGVMGMVANREAEQLARNELAQIRESMGEGASFDEKHALGLANGILNEEYGVDASEALRRAAHFTNEYETRIRAEEREKIMAELGQVAGAPNTAPLTGVPAGQTLSTPQGPNRYEEVVARHIAKRNAGFPVG